MRERSVQLAHGWLISYSRAFRVTQVGETLNLKIVWESLRPPPHWVLRCNLFIYFIFCSNKEELCHWPAQHILDEVQHFISQLVWALAKKQRLFGPMYLHKIHIQCLQRALCTIFFFIMTPSTFKLHNFLIFYSF